MSNVNYKVCVIYYQGVSLVRCVRMILGKEKATHHEWCVARKKAFIGC